MLTSLLTLLQKAFVRTISFPKETIDAAADDDWESAQMAVSDAIGPKELTTASLTTHSGFSTDGTHYFEIVATAFIPATGQIRDSGTASFANKTAVAGQKVSATFNDPVEVRAGDIVFLTIHKVGNGELLDQGLAQISG